MPASRRRRVTVKPSMSGSMTSRTIRSGARLGFVKCAASVLGGDDVEACEAQGGGEEVADVGFVVNDEQFCLCSGGGHGCSVLHDAECFLIVGWENRLFIWSLILLR